MRGWCWCAVLCALVGVCTTLEGEALEEAERQLLALLGLQQRPTRRPTTHPARVPVAMRTLYDEGAIPARAANTVRSYRHSASPVDHRFPNEHRFRLFFDVSGVPVDEVARGADLRMQRSPSTAGSQRLLLYDIIKPGRRGRYAPILRLIDSVPMSAGEGIVNVDALGAVRRWLAEPENNHGLLVRVIEGDEDAREPHVRVRRRASETEESWSSAQPLLMLYTEDARAREARERGETILTRNKRASRRGHRGHHRRKEARDENCQRRPLFVDFADVGWSDWIVAPMGYDAYYCQGDCPFPLKDHLNGTNHAIVQTLVNSVNPAAVPKACCVPTQLSSISMLYMDESNNVVLKNYQDMIVVGCGCR